MNRPALTVDAVTADRVRRDRRDAADQQGSFDETVPSAGPWTRVEAKATLGAKIPALAGACTGAGTNDLPRFRDPDTHMAAANRRHEDRHAAVHRAASNASIVRWDRS